MSYREIYISVYCAYSGSSTVYIHVYIVVYLVQNCLRVQVASSLFMCMLYNWLTNHVISSKYDNLKSGHVFPFPGPAGFPRDFMIQDTTSRTFNITWSSPDPLLQYGIITQYNLTCSETVLDRMPPSYPRTYSSPPSPSVVTVDDLRPSTEYMCSVIAINSAGSSDPTSDTSFTEDDG